jgi:hypothetical protein
MLSRLQRILIPLAVAALLLGGWRAWGWAGVALVGGGVLLWLLLHFTRLMHVLRRAADSPLGYVGSAVMLQAKLRPGMTLLQVVAFTRALGEQLSAPGEQPERYRWRDPSDASVSCEFLHGRLQRWEFRRPDPGADGAGPPAP